MGKSLSTFCLPHRAAPMLCHLVTYLLSPLHPPPITGIFFPPLLHAMNVCRAAPPIMVLWFCQPPLLTLRLADLLTSPIRTIPLPMPASRIRHKPFSAADTFLPSRVRSHREWRSTRRKWHRAFSISIATNHHFGRPVCSVFWG